MKTQRRNLVVDLDRTFVDILTYQQYESLLDPQYKSLIMQAFSTGKKESTFHRITFQCFDFVVVIRRGTTDFFRALSAKYSLHVVSYIHKDLTIQLLNLIDPEGTIFVMKEKRVKQYEPNQAKQTGDVLERAYNKHDFVIIDRTECPWMYTDQQKLIIVKTFAPISGKVIVEHSLSEFPLRIEQTQPVRPISSNYPPYTVACQSRA